MKTRVLKPGGNGEENLGIRIFFFPLMHISIYVSLSVMMISYPFT